MQVKLDKVRQTIEGSLIAKGLDKERAEIVADEYLEGELEGKKSHGLMAFPSLLEKLDGKQKEIKIIKRTNAFVYIDANENIGSWVGSKASEIAMEMAKKEGISLALIGNMTTWLRPGTLAKKIADKGFIALVFNNGGKPMTAPPGGYDPVIGTNPTGIGIPADGDSVVADMATSVKAWGEVRKAERFGHDLPKDVYLDKQGGFAVKPQDAYSVLPTGDYKGFALGLLIEILTGSLMERGMGQTQMKGDYRTMTRGGVIIVIDPTATTSLAKFKKANSNLLKEIKGSKKLKGVEEIYIPGEKAIKTKEENLKNGYIEIEEDLWQKLEGK